MPLGVLTDADFQKELEKCDGQNNPAQNTEHVHEPSIESEVSVPDSIVENNESFSAEVLPAEINESNRGRGKGNFEVPNGIRKLIGGSVIEEGRPAGLAIAAFLGISESSVSAYSNGATSTASYNKPEKGLADFLGNTRKKISKKAAAKLFKALHVIDDDSLAKLSALEASNVAKNMSTIINHMEPPDNNKGLNINAPSMVFYVPKMVSEERFHVVTANE